MSGLVCMPGLAECVACRLQRYGHELTIMYSSQFSRHSQFVTDSYSTCNFIPNPTTCVQLYNVHNIIKSKALYSV